MRLKSCDGEWADVVVLADNEIRDIGQGLLGLVAERRGTRVVDVMGEFGVGEKD